MFKQLQDCEKPSFNIRKCKQPFQASKQNLRSEKENRRVNEVDPSTNLTKCQLTKKIFKARCKTQHLISQVNQLPGDHDEGTQIPLEKDISELKLREHTTQIGININKFKRRISIIPVPRNPMISNSSPYKGPTRQSVSTNHVPMKNMKEHNLIQLMFSSQFELNDIKVQCSLDHQSDVLQMQSFSIDDYEKLVEWVYDICTTFYQFSSNETFFLAIEICKSYLRLTKRFNYPSINIKRLNRQDLHLLGAVSIFIASKVVDIYAISIEDLYHYVLHEIFNIHQILEQEQCIVKKLGFQVYLPTSFSIYTQIFQTLFREFKEVLISSFNFDQYLKDDLNQVQYLSIEKLKQMMKVYRFTSYSLIQQAVSSLLQSLKEVLPEQNKEQYLVKQYCLQRVLKLNNHVKLNINTLEKLENEIQLLTVNTQKVLKY